MRGVDVAANIEYAMDRLDMSSQELAAGCGLSYDQFRYLMRDPEGRMKLAVLRRIARKLDTTAAWLISGTPAKR